MYDATKIAEYAIEYENKKNRPISNLRLQKLLYFIQAQFLVNNHEPCFEDEMEAWDFGPVVPSVYHEYKYFGSSSIPLSASKKSYDIYDDDKDLIEHILDRCAQYSTTELVSITHRQTPWREAYSKSFNRTISPKAIQSFFGG